MNIAENHHDYFRPKAPSDPKEFFAKIYGPSSPPSPPSPPTPPPVCHIRPPAPHLGLHYSTLTSDAKVCLPQLVCLKSVRFDRHIPLLICLLNLSVDIDTRWHPIPRWPPPTTTSPTFPCLPMRLAPYSGFTTYPSLEDSLLSVSTLCLSFEIGVGNLFFGGIPSFPALV